MWDQHAGLSAEALRLVDRSFEESHKDVTNLGDSVREWGEKAEVVARLSLESDEGFYRVPSLNEVKLVENLPPNGLVRFRCMVQDCFEPEYYSGVYRILDTATGETRLATTKYRESYPSVAALRAAGLELDTSCRADTSSLFCRQVLYAVPPPGETDWAWEEGRKLSSRHGGIVPSSSSLGCDLEMWEGDDTKGSTRSKGKRGRSEEETEGGEEIPAAAASDVVMEDAKGAEEKDKESTETYDKRVRTGSPCMPQCAGAAAASSAVSPSAQVLGGMSAEEAATLPRSSEEFGLNFPLQWESAEGVRKRGSEGLEVRPLGCLLKFADMEDRDLPKLNELIEVVGFLGVSPDTAEFHDSSLVEDASDALFFRDATAPASSLVPRIHVLAVRKLHNHLPALPTNSQTDPRPPIAPLWQQIEGKGPLSTAAAVRRRLLQLLARPLGGDGLAAEFLLTALASSSFKTPGATSDSPSGGVVTLNMRFGKPGMEREGSEKVGGGLVRVLESVCPRVADVKVTVKNLEKFNFAPKKDFILNRLVSGVLQVSAGTVVVLDELVLDEGKLTHKGIERLQAAGHFVKELSVQYDFGAYKMPFSCKALPVVLSHGRPLVMGADFVVPVDLPGGCGEGGQENSEENVPVAPEEELAQIRYFLGLCAAREGQRLLVGDSMNNRISADFADRRQQDKNLSIEDLQKWLALARARAFSLGEEELSVAVWRETLALEDKRKGREKLWESARATIMKEAAKQRKDAEAKKQKAQQEQQGAHQEGTKAGDPSVPPMQSG
uniref:Mini-chromosome maintenance complex-binding protein n=1 Tax=Chromera velia CCMP2878 TaxID=1169474 RepID=A0A0G4I2X5_9ALVE|eukprot:Cvel_10529.t1-p1 / transcript=Cvel_10529.t1 / gene=Cvel_10529 / organism=Chromera_velia_CCMP2878 / gene_product=Mini-chromosome maintenance complex-binding protein, putative / transcript_product=Mini-chromosome maintenance complex-binding protein, putative / location=Cvel_scaffold637:22237-29268(-) / protein_length=779 / sequence_SO=supercontig / SO=protein_coding / is_pseudo=false